MFSIEQMNTVLALGLLTILGVLGSLLLRTVKFPAITGFLIIGVLLGPSVFSVFSMETASQFSHVLVPVALGIIAYLIGGSLPLSSLRGLKRSITFITLLQGGFPWLFVLVLVALVAPLLLTSTALGFESYLIMGIIIGAISLATAPAATLAIIRESRARGPLTTTLLAVVALDDGLAIIAFAIALGTASILAGAAEALSPGLLLLWELGRIGLSLALGGLFSLALLGLTRVAQTRQETLVIVLGMVILSAGLAEYLGLHPLLTNMTLGFVVVNRQRPSQDLIGVIHDIEGVVFVLFFTLAGTHLDLRIIESAGVLAVLIVLGRCGGKFFGSWLGATLSGAPQAGRRYLGLTLLPKAGVTVGLALLVLEVPELQEISNLLVSGVLASTLINELLTPPLAKFALDRAGETGKGEARAMIEQGRLEAVPE